MRLILQQNNTTSIPSPGKSYLTAVGHAWSPTRAHLMVHVQPLGVIFIVVVIRKREGLLWRVQQKEDIWALIFEKHFRT